MQKLRLRIENYCKQAYRAKARHSSTRLLHDSPVVKNEQNRWLPAQKIRNSTHWAPDRDWKQRHSVDNGQRVNSGQTVGPEEGVVQYII